MIRKLILGIVLLAIIIGSASAATQEEIKTSIDKGLEYLASTQNADGSWYTSDKVARTGFAVLKFEEYARENGMSPFDPTYKYSQNVINGLDYIFAQLREIAIVNQGVNNPDSDGDHKGIYGADHYDTSMALMAIAGSQEPTRNVTVGPFAGRTYYNVSQNMVDFFAYGQTDGTSGGRGGWDYGAHNNAGGRSDNSNSGWVTLALGFANTYFGIPTPQFVKTELNFWIDYVQNDASGGSGYTGPTDYVNIYKTGNLLYEMKLVGDNLTTPRVQNAVTYIETNWNLPNMEPGWRDGATTSNYQATYALLKGLEAFGISQLNIPGPTDWFDNMVDEIVPEQISINATKGYWTGCGVWGTDSNVCTVWALLTIEKAVVGPDPQCRDGIDNDGDGYTDYVGGDPGCTNPDDNDETDTAIPEFPTVALPVLSVIGIMFLLHRKKK